MTAVGLFIIIFIPFLSLHTFYTLSANNQPENKEPEKNL